MENQTITPATSRLEGHQLLGDYEVLSVAGSGGMGLVYRARQNSLGRVVALKVIRDEVARAPEYRERFMREPRLAASVDHPHIVAVYEVGEEQGQLFLAMQWVNGEDLKRAIRRQGRLAPNRALRIATQIAGALHAVHSTAGLVHRDVKPANVLIREVRGGDHAYLTDFGIAKATGGGEQLTVPGGVLGTPGYMSPEQIRGGEPGPQSDLYALGCVFYEALTGQPPFRGDSDMALMWAHAHDPRPVPSLVVPELGDRYDNFVSVALAIDPAHRFESGEAFADALDALHPTTVAPQLTSPPLPIIVGPDTPVPPTTAIPQANLTASMLPPPSASAIPPAPYPADGSVTPAPTALPRGGGRNRLAVIGLCVVALAGIVVGALTAGGVFSHNPQKVTTSTTGASTPPGGSSTSTPISTSTPVIQPADTTACGGGVFVNAHASCGFADNVAQMYDETAGGTQPVTAYSAARSQKFTIDCTGGPSVVCTGGTTVGATIYFTYAGTSNTGNG
jgi:serine/threonine protein kinase